MPIGPQASKSLPKKNKKKKKEGLPASLELVFALPQSFLGKLEPAFINVAGHVPPARRPSNAASSVSNFRLGFG